ncbi:MAG: DUF6599 family protein [Bryobacteraceae bacterium]
MPRRCGLILGCLLFAGLVFADDQALWREYGLVHSESSELGKTTVTKYQMKDVTGALAAWEWLRSDKGRICDLASFCTIDGDQTVISEANFVLKFQGAIPSKAQLDALLQGLTNKRDSSLPAILTFLPRQGLIPDSARYVLGPVSLKAFAPELGAAKPGFDQGAEAQTAEYKAGNSATPVHLAIFYYPTPEMARLHSAELKAIAGTHVKRSASLVAVVFGSATDDQADTILSRIEYEAKITLSDIPPPSPIKPLYRLLLNIMYLSIVLSAICLLAGLIYAGMRIYRRRYGTLEADEAMTTLHLT